MNVTNDVVVTFERVSFDLNGTLFLDNIDLSIIRGERFVLFGPSGSGRSFFIRLMTGLLSPMEGKVSTEGVNPSEAVGIRKRLGSVFRNIRLLNNMTLFENIALPLRYHTHLSDDEIERRVERMMQFVGVEAWAMYRPAFVGSLFQVEAAIARAFILRPSLLLFDDLTVGLCPVSSKKVLRLVFRLAEELDDVNPPFSEEDPRNVMTFFMTASHVELYFAIADRMAMLYKGHLITIGTPEEIQGSHHPIVRSFFEGEDENVL